MRIRDPGWKKFGSGINIPDPQHWCRKADGGVGGGEVGILAALLWIRKYFFLIRNADLQS